MASPRVFANAIGSLAGRSPQSVKRVAAAIMNSPETLAKLPKAMQKKLASGNPQEIAEVVAYVAGPAAAGAAVVGGVMNAGSSPADLSDGLTGAPQDEITPEPVAGEGSTPAVQPPAQQRPAGPPQWDGEMSKEQVVELLDQFDQSLPADPSLRAEYESLYPPNGTQEGYEKRARYQAYINSLPQNSPEAMARKRKRWAESDAKMVDFANRLGLPGVAAQLQEFDRQAGLYPTQASPSPAGGYQSDLPPGLDPNNPRWGGDPARVQQLMDANPEAFFGPGELTPEQEQQKKRLLSNRKSYYDQRYYAQTPDGKPVFQPKQEEFRVPYDPGKMPQATVPETGNEELGVPPLDRFEYTDEARRMRDGEATASVMAGGSEMNLSLSEQRQAQQLIRARAVRIARERGEDPAKVAEELMASSRLYRDPATGRLGLANGDDTFYKNRKRETDDYALRRERVKQRGLMGLSPSQSALSNNVVEARRILGDPDASDEERLAAKYWLSPQSFMVDYAAAQNPSQSSSAEELIKMQIAQQAAQQQAREGDPVGAGISDAKESKFSKQAMDWIEDEAAAFDEDWLGFTRESERRFAEYLKETYGFTQDQAEEAARRGANSRRWFWQKRGGGQDSGPDSGDSGGGGF